MSAIDTIRDALYGNPPVEGFKPSREGVVKAFTEMMGLIVFSSFGIATYPTQAAMNAVAPGVDDAHIAFVNNDPDATKNNVYAYRNGAWSVYTEFYSGVASVVQPLLDAAKAASDKAVSANQQAQKAAFGFNYTVPSPYDPNMAFQTTTPMGNGFAIVMPMTMGQYYADSMPRALASVRLYATADSPGIIVKRAQVLPNGNCRAFKTVGTVNVKAGPLGTEFVPDDVVVFGPNETLVFFQPAGSSLCYNDIPGPLLYILSADPNNDYATAEGVHTDSTFGSLMVSAVFVETDVVSAEAETNVTALRARYSQEIVVDRYAKDAAGSAGTDNVDMFSDTFGRKGLLLDFNQRAQTATPRAFFELWQRNADRTYSFVRVLFMRNLIAGDNKFKAGVDFPFLEVEANWCIKVYSRTEGISITSNNDYGAEAGAFRFGHSTGQNLPPVFRVNCLRLGATIGVAAPARRSVSETQTFHRMWTFGVGLPHIADQNGVIPMTYYDKPIYPPTMTPRGVGDAYVRRGEGKYTGFPLGGVFGNICITRDPFRNFPLWIGTIGRGLQSGALGVSYDGIDFELRCEIPTIQGMLNTYIVSPFIDYDGTFYLVITYEIGGQRPGGGIYADAYLFRSTAEDNSSFENLGVLTDGPIFNEATIDVTMYRRENLYYLMCKDEVKGSLFVASSPNVNGPWSMAWDLRTDARISPQLGGMMVEGGKLAWLSDGRVRVYFDAAFAQGFSFAEADYFGGPLGPIYKISTPDDLSTTYGEGRYARAGEVIEITR